jgi:hypothetical protein
MWQHVFCVYAVCTVWRTAQTSAQLMFYCCPQILLNYYNLIILHFSDVTHNILTEAILGIDKYKVIKKSLCAWWLQYRKLQVIFKASPASLQTFIDTPNCVLEDRVQYSTVHIPNVFCDGHLQHINCVMYCTLTVRCIETIWSSCIICGGKKNKRTA